MIFKCSNITTFYCISLRITNIICRIFEIKPGYVQMEQAKQNRWYLSLFDRWEPDSLEQPIGKLQILNVFNMLFSSQLVLTKYNKLLNFTACSKRNKSLIILK